MYKERSRKPLREVQEQLKEVRERFKDAVDPRNPLGSIPRTRPTGLAESVLGCRNSAAEARGRLSIASTDPLRLILMA